MDMSNRNATPDEKFTALNTSLDTLAELGVETAEVLAPEYDLINRVHVLNAHRTAHHKSVGINPIGIARDIMAGDVLDYAHVVSQANNAAFIEDKGQHDRVQQILAAASDQAMTAAAARFRKRGNGVLEILRPAFDELAGRIVETWAEIPEGVTTLNQAAEHDAHVAWVQLTRMHDEWANMAGLIASWFIDGVIDNQGDHPSRDYQPAMFMVEDFAAYKAEQARPSEIARVGAGLTAGTPMLRTIQQVDESGIKFELSTARELATAQRNEREAAEEARRDLNRAKPQRTRLDRDGKKAMINLPV